MGSRMQSKVLIAIAVAALLAGGCTTHRPESITQNNRPATTIAPYAVTPPSSPSPTPSPVRKTSSSVAPKTTPAPSADIIFLIRAKATWIEHGRSLVVITSTAGQPVPLFRQAIVLASVRAALAKGSIRPDAEFRRGLLTLTFSNGTPAQIAEAINRALSIPEVRKLVAILPG